MPWGKHMFFINNNSKDIIVFDEHMSIVDVNNILLLLLIQNHVFTSIVDKKPRACLMALLPNTMRCILQVKA